MRSTAVGAPAQSWLAGTRLGAIVARRDLVVELVRMEFVTRYNGTLLGVLWTQLYPLLLLGVYSFVFTTIFRSDIPHFPLFLFSGIVLWQFCSMSIQLGTNSILANSFLIGRVAFPREIMTISTVLVAGIDLLMSHVIIVAGALIFGVMPTWSWLALPPLVVLLGLLCLGAGLALATVAVYLPDIRWFVEVAMLMLMFLSPVFYSETMVPDSVAWVFRINPLARVLAAYRHALLDGLWPDAATWGVLGIWAVVALGLGLAVFGRWQKGFVDAL
jgi:ABC-type polysaccharide/polyol phosphate export permease